MSKLTTTNIVGTASKTTWSQAQSVAFGDSQLLIVIQLRADDSDSMIDLTVLGPQILSEIKEKGQESVESLCANSAEGLQVDLVVAMLNGTNLSFRGHGGIDVYLARNKQLAKMGNNGNGILREGDVVVLSTKKFVEVIGLSKFKDVLIQENNPAELLTPLVHVQTETSGVAAIVGEIKKEKKEIKWPQIKILGEEPRKKNLLVGGVIFIMLIIMIGVGMVRRVRQIAERDFVSLSASVNSKVEEAMSVGDLNPDRARYLLSQAKNEVDAYLITDITEDYKLKGKKLVEDIVLADEQTFKKNDIKLSTVAELGILIDGLKSDQMKSNGKDNLIFLDTQKSRIVEMNLMDRSRQIIDIGDNEKYTDLGVGETRVHGLRINGVTEFTWKKDSTKKVIEADEFWKNPTYIEMFAGNVYILDKEQGEIWKYPTLGDTFGGRRRWFAVGITPDLSNVIDMKVVGDIWLLTSTGKLERYSRGAPVPFGMEGFPALGEAKRLSDPVAVWVTESLIYVVERGASRVVVFGDDGKYRSQYVNPEFAKASDLVVVDNKAYVLIDNTVKEFGL